MWLQDMQACGATSTIANGSMGVQNSFLLWEHMQCGVTCRDVDRLVSVLQPTPCMVLTFGGSAAASAAVATAQLPPSAGAPP